jgi:hypothetical protein
VQVVLVGLQGKLVSHSFCNNISSPSALLHRRIEKVSNLPTPITTRNPVQNLPKSMTAFPALSMKSSGFEHRPQIQFGSGAIT